MAVARHVKVVMGAMEFGRPQRESADAAVCRAMLRACTEAGVRELDTARIYTEGASERLLGDMLAGDGDLQRLVVVSTKASPAKEPWLSLSADSVQGQLEESLRSLRLACVDVFYLHWPDPHTPLESTLAAVDALFRRGLFRRFGLSNYSSWQVLEIYHCCQSRGYVLPTVYQGMYNALTRAVEAELLPALRRCGIAFYAFNPLCGGILAGRHSYSDEAAPPSGSSRFFGCETADRYRRRFWHRSYFDALDLLRAAAAEAYGAMAPPLAELALRWLRHHSGLDGERGDAVVLGASSLGQLKANLAACAAGPLDARVVAALDAGARLARPHWAPYFR